MKTSELKLRDRNPRRITDAALDKLAESIKRDPEFMTLRPIVTDADGVVLGGNQRLKAIQKRGMTEIPDSWVVKAADLTEEQMRRFILVDNAPEGMAGDWDFDLLKMDFELPELEEIGFDLENLSVPNFSPGDEDGQDKLDEMQPKWVICPHCGKEFDCRE